MKFKIIRRYSLKDLGEEWTDCYLEFTPITIREVQTDISKLSNVDTKDPKSVLEGTKTTIDLLKSHFVAGKAIGETGEVIDVKAEDLDEMPAEVLGAVLNFLSVGTSGGSSAPSQS